ncbi:MAG: indolepyruvate ferredoxin oxidoreductase family protein [Rhizobiales bacterium]|nr:indolepyruvate ferredoxin oxidoreductase family protein [Hyphomicrobiales bacterium]
MTSPVSLDDKYDLTKDRIYISGPQVFVRLMLMQKAIDEAAGLNTAGYVTGYRGSPVGGVDQAFERAQAKLEPMHIKFQPGLNEDLAATALWGSQQAEMRGEGAFDGVFGIWYGKGPGVDRSGDVLRHANAAGTSKHGGVLAMAGDDHGAESSTVPHQSEFALLDAMMPILNPAGLQELLDFGLYGYALSRFSGCWVGIKCVHDTVESTGVIEAGLDRIRPVIPADFKMPPGGLNIRPADDRLDQEKRLHNFKRFAAVAFARANKLNRIVFRGGPNPKIGIVSAGKSYLDVRQALDELGIDEAMAAKIGLRLLKVGMVWPLDHDIVYEFARGLDLVICVEEKRLLIETHVRELLFNDPTRPLVIGKKDEADNHLFPAYGKLEPNQIAIAIGERILKTGDWPQIAAKVAAIKAAQARISNQPDLVTRIPYFCAGCPHNSSTVLPEGARGYAGIGCHWMVQFIPERNTEGSTQMGGEGANWIGEAPFSKRKHVFQNLGDGTYNHSGILAIRAAIASGVNITYKILYNDAVAMTGGQHHDGPLNVPMIANQMRAEGVERIAIVSDEPHRHAGAQFPPRVTFHHRDDLQALQKEFMEVPGTSVIIYDQTCAAEKRRRRKRGAYPDPNKRVFINEAVCEGCGDCGVQSNCVAIVPVETTFGRKRQIDQSACNKDYSCLKGFCPSFVTIEGAEMIKGLEAPKLAADGAVFPVLPEPMLPKLDAPWSIMVTGIGGTGVITVGHVLGMAAHLEGKGADMIDMVGLAQKNGAVVTHLKIAARPEDIAAVRIAAGGADLILGCDLVTAASERVLATASSARTNAVINTHEAMPAQFTRNADLKIPGEQLQMKIAARCKADGVHAIEATRIATALLGDSIATNLFVVGYAYQLGLIPLSAEAVQQAIRLNGAAIEMNLNAFLWGRRAAHDLRAVEAILAPREPAKPVETLDDLINGRAAILTEYQNAAYADRYRQFVAGVRARENAVAPGSNMLTTAVARYLYKLMAYKDEYEVARLYADEAYAKVLRSRFKGGRLTFHLAPPILARRDPATGLPRKMTFGPWMLSAFKTLAKFRFLRGTAFDPFGRSPERKRERALIGEYRATVERLLPKLTPDNIAAAAEIASIPDLIRGYGHVKDHHLAAAKEREGELLALFEKQPAGPVQPALAAE